MRVTIVSGSHRPDSQSGKVARHVAHMLAGEVEAVVDLGARRCRCRTRISPR